MTAPAVIAAIVKTPARGPSNRFIIENILAVPGIVFWGPFLQQGCGIRMIRRMRWRLRMPKANVVLNLFLLYFVIL